MKKWFIENALADMKRVWIKRNFRRRRISPPTTFILVLSLSLSLPLLIGLFVFWAVARKRGKWWRHTIAFHRFVIIHQKGKEKRTTFFFWCHFRIMIRDFDISQRDYYKLAKRNIVLFGPLLTISAIDVIPHTTTYPCILGDTSFLRFSPFVVLLLLSHPPCPVFFREIVADEKGVIVFPGPESCIVFCGVTKTSVARKFIRMDGWMDTLLQLLQHAVSFFFFAAKLLAPVKEKRIDILKRISINSKVITQQETWWGRKTSINRERQEKDLEKGHRRRRLSWEDSCNRFKRTHHLLFGTRASSTRRSSRFILKGRTQDVSYIPFQSVPPQK